MARIVRKIVNSLILAAPFTAIYDRIASHTTFGKRGELAAERYLLRKGFVIVHRGYADKSGEIDLVAVDGRTIVFVEVKTRKDDSKGLPAEAVDQEKQTHLTRTALGYLKWHRLTECKSRFDVVSIIWPDETKPPAIDHFENAFEPVGEFQMF